jgi:ribosomal protein L7Ae-like RNA K-turn-binding protein
VFRSLNSENKLRQKHLETIKREIMKTTIKTLITICALGFIGILNTNATVNYTKSGNTVVFEEEKNVKSGSNKVDENLAIPTAQTIFLESDVRFENVESVLPLLNEDLDAETDFQKEAQLITKWVVDQKEAQVIQQLTTEGKFDKVDLVQPAVNEDLNAETDFQKEAQIITKWVADKEEAKAVQKLISEGKL